jgi:hypothetical protein
MSDVVQTIYDNWGNRASLKEPDLSPDGERVFKVGGYSITVPDDRDTPAKVSSLYNRWGRNENPMPNMSFSEGEMRIPIEDLVDLILRRVPADELAEGLWRDETVRDSFVECMANRYAGAVEDEDRRKLLTKIQVQIYAKAIDRAIERLNHAETGQRTHTDYYRWKDVELGHYRGLYDDAMRLIGDDDAKRQNFEARHMHPDKLSEYIKGERDPVVKESVGTQWHESRDYWRKRLEEFFPEPVEATP